ncbi:MAG: glycosyltransferase [Bacteroidetes bacterium]|nr:glycosyltransferase [Bacteroidota bacterium]
MHSGVTRTGIHWTQNLRWQPLSNERRRIAIVLPNLGGGGAERLHVYLANDWVERGHDVEILLMQSWGELLPLLSPRVRVVDLKSSRVRNIFRPLSMYLKRVQPDATLAAMWSLTSASVIAWMLSGRRGRLFLSDHSMLSISCVTEHGLSTRFVGGVIRMTYPFATGIIAVSEGVKEDLCRLGGLRPDDVEVIYNPTATGVSPERESPEIQQQLWGVDPCTRILAVGRLKAQKDFATLLRAFAALPAVLNAKLVILGEGPQRSLLESLIREFSLEHKVQLRGFVVDPYPWYRSADLFVLSSKWEGFGNVLVEALECGLPIVSTDCPSGPSEILENGRYGTLVPVGNPHAITAAMVNAVTATQDRDRLMERAKAFSVRAISERYLEFCFPEMH